MGLEVGGELGGDGRGEGLVCGVGAVARVAEDADLVFDLHHEDGAIGGVDLGDVLHEGGEGAGVGLLQVGGGGREHLNGRAALNDAREAFGIALDPDGRVTGHAVLPGGEPEEDDLLVLGAGLGEESVDEGEVVGAFGGLDELPCERGDDCVEAEGGHAGPDGLHVVERGGGGVEELSAEDEEGIAVDDELSGLAVGFEAWGRGLSGEEGGGENDYNSGGK